MHAARDRSLGWEGLLNGRELGGIPTAYGPILGGALVRSASVHTLGATGWRELQQHGIKSIVDLRHQWEIDEATIPAQLLPSEVALLHQPLEPAGYVETWSGRDDRWKLSSPHYFDEFMAEHALLVGDALAAVASAPPGGVLVHCYAGKDRAGLTIAMILDLLGVDHEIIIADHWISFDRARSLEAELGKQESPGKPAPDKAVYATVMSDLLAQYPASSCFADRGVTDNIRMSLAERLCGAVPVGTVG